MRRSVSRVDQKTLPIPYWYPDDSNVARSRRGYTLLELMVALALSLFLLGTINLALNLQVQYSVAGRAAGVQSQVLRSVIDRLTQDIRSTVPQPHFADQNKIVQAGSISVFAVPEESSDNGLAEPQSVSSLWGSRDVLVLRTNHRHRSFANPLPATIVWYSGTTDIRQLQDLPGFEFAPAELSHAIDSQVNGLTRRDLGMPLANGQRPLTTDRAHQLLVGVDEIQQLRFRFYDGRQWHSVWDSVARAELPKAIEVRLELAPSSPSDAGVAGARRGFRTVIDLPTSHLQSTIL